MKRAIVLLPMLFYPAICSATPTAEFVARWDALKKNAGHASLQDIASRPEAKAYVREFGDAAMALKQKLAEAKNRNQPVDVCPPHEVKLDMEGVMADARQLPAAWQSRPFADSFAQIMKNRYPCPTP